MKPIRDLHLKIPDIKNVRSLTKLLGKIGIKDLYRDNPVYLGAIKYGYTPHSSHQPKVYGLGLAEVKHYVESKYSYQVLGIPPKRNMIQDIKVTRRFMAQLRLFGIKSADSGLAFCKFYVTGFVPPEQYSLF